jgi:hypothetical protein
MHLLLLNLDFILPHLFDKLIEMLSKFCFLLWHINKAEVFKSLNYYIPLVLIALLVLRLLI